MSEHRSGRASTLSRLCTGISVAVLLLLSSLAAALPQDKDQPIHITADKAVRDEKKGVTVYSGNVFMKQGSMELEADLLTIYHDTDNASRIVAQGNPAKMRQLPEPDQGLVHAHAQTIHYFRTQDRVHLQTEARIEQDGDMVAGDSIDYLIDKQMFKAESSGNQEGAQVEVVIQPNAQPGKAKVSIEPTVPAQEPAEQQDEASADTALDDAAPTTDSDEAAASSPADTEQEQESRDSGATASE